MSKNKLKKFADMAVLPNVFQITYQELQDKGQAFPMQGHWHDTYFKNQNPIVLELGCGKGEYAIGLAQKFPNKNFIGLDIKGARMWTGATKAHEEGLKNVAFIRSGINLITNFFAPNEVAELWITFADPQMKKVNKRLTSSLFLGLYKQVLQDNGLIHLKTDSSFLYTYTEALAKCNQLPIKVSTTDLYQDLKDDLLLDIQTYYEKQWLSRGLTIKYLQFCLPHDLTLKEPEIEIPLDDYRSFNRQKRSELNLTK